MKVEDISNEEFQLKKQKMLEQGQIKLAHDELIKVIGEDVYKLITDAGYVLVPKRWRDDVFCSLSTREPEKGFEEELEEVIVKRYKGDKQVTFADLLKILEELHKSGYLHK